MSQPAPAPRRISSRVVPAALLPGVLVYLGIALLAGCDEPQVPRPPRAVHAAPAPTAELRVEAPPPPFSDGIFPCTDCHDPALPVNTKKRPMRMAHTEIVLRHDEAHRWCLDCHAVGNRDKLHLASGELIDFTESHRLCGQCHGDKHRDWRAGVHGRRSGSWNDHKTYLLCVHCHNAHAPAFQPIAPLPMPARPERTQ